MTGGLTVKLYDRAREPVASVPLPAFWEPPRVIVWRDRYFVLANDGEFREAQPYIVFEGEQP